MGRSRKLQADGTTGTIPGDTSSRWSHGEKTTTRVRFAEVEAEETFAPAVPPLPAEETEEREATVPDFGHSVTQSIDELIPGEAGAVRAVQRGTHAKPEPVDTPPPATDPVEGLTEIEPGAVVAERYRVVRILGEGGMGRVFEVQHARLGKTFALKILRADLGADERIRKSFFREAKFASSLEHPNVLSIVDFGEDRTYGAYMVMEYIEGTPLNELLERKQRLSVRRACDVIAQLAEALRYIHRHDIVHCDIKSRNILLAEDPTDKRRRMQVKLLDFGLARSMSQGAPKRLFGTPEYLAPELARREPATPRSDVYALGILLYELLVGKVPFEGSVNQIVRQHIHREMPRPSSALERPIDPALERLIMTATAKEPMERHKDMAAFLYELKTVMNMMGFPRTRRTATVASPLPSAPAEDPRTEIIRSTFENFRLPIASVDARGEIVAANAAFSRFMLGVVVKLEGTRIQDTLLAPAWSTLEEDLAAACKGQTIGRVIEVDRSVEGKETARLQMWLEPTGMPGVVCFSVHPTTARE